MGDAKKILPIYYKYISITLSIVLVCQNAAWAGTVDRSSCLSPASYAQRLGKQTADLRNEALIREFFISYQEDAALVQERLRDILTTDDILPFLKLPPKELARYGSKTFVAYLIYILKLICAEDRPRFYRILKDLEQNGSISEIVRQEITEELRELVRRKQIRLSAMHDTKAYLSKLIVSRLGKAPEPSLTIRNGIIEQVRKEDEFLADYLQDNEQSIRLYLVRLAEEVNSRYLKISRQAQKYRDAAFAPQYLEQMSADIEVFMNMIDNICLVLDVYLKVCPNPYIGYDELAGEQREQMKKRFESYDGLRDVLRQMGYIPFILKEGITGKLAKEFIDVDLRRLLADIVRQRSEYFRLPVDIVGFQGEALAARVNPVHLRRVVSNILFNTIEARSVEKGGCSRVSLRENEDNTVTVRLANNGGRIAEDEHGSIDYIFDFGFTTKDRGLESSGIGLHIVRRMVELVGGIITVENTEELGEPGVAFVITLPLAEEKGQESQKAWNWKKIFSFSWWRALLRRKGNGDFQLSLPARLNKRGLRMGLVFLGIIAGVTLFGLEAQAGLYLVFYSFSIYAHEAGHLLSQSISRVRLWLRSSGRQLPWGALPGGILRSLKGIFWDLRIDIKLPGSADKAILRAVAAGYMMNLLLMSVGLVLLAVDYLAGIGVILFSVNILLLVYHVMADQCTISRLTGEKEIVVLGRLIQAFLAAFFRGKRPGFLETLRQRQIHKKMIIADLATLINPPTTTVYRRLPVFDSGEETDVVIDSEVTAALRQLPVGVVVTFFAEAAYHFIRGSEGSLQDHPLRELTGSVDVCVTAVPEGTNIEDVEEQLRFIPLFEVEDFQKVKELYLKSPFTTDRVGVALFVGEEGRLGPGLVDLTLAGQSRVESWRQMRRGRVDFFPAKEKTLTPFNQLTALGYFFQRGMALADPVRQAFKAEFRQRPQELEFWLEQSLEYALGIDSVEPLTGFLARVEYLFSGIVEDAKLLELVADLIAARLGTEAEQLVGLFFGGTKAVSFKREVFAYLKRKNIISTLTEVDQLAEKEVPEDVLSYIIGSSADWPDIARWEEKLVPPDAPAILELVMLAVGMALLFYSGPQLALVLLALPVSAYLHELAHWLVMGGALAIKGKWPRLKLENIVSFFRSVFWDFSVPNKLPPEAKTAVRLTAASGYLVNLGLLVLGVLLINSGSYLAVGIALVASNFFYLAVGFGRDICSLIWGLVWSRQFSSMIKNFTNADLKAVISGKTEEYKIEIVSAHISKQIEVIRVQENKQGYLMAKAREKGTGKVLKPFRLWQEQLNLESNRRELQENLADEDYSGLVEEIFDIANDLPGEIKPRFCLYRSYLRDLAGFARPSDKVIARHDLLKSNPVALFHELAEYLLKARQGQARKGLLDLVWLEEGEDRFIQLKVRGSFSERLREIGKVKLSPEVLSFITKEDWAQGWQNDSHYLLRVLQRELFGEADEELSAAIQALQFLQEIAGYGKLTRKEKTLVFIAAKSLFLAGVINPLNRAAVRERLFAGPVRQLLFLKRGLAKLNFCASLAADSDFSLERAVDLFSSYLREWEIRLQKEDMYLISLDNKMIEYRRRKEVERLFYWGNKGSSDDLLKLIDEFKQILLTSRVTTHRFYTRMTELMGVAAKLTDSGLREMVQTAEFLAQVAEKSGTCAPSSYAGFVTLLAAVEKRQWRGKRFRRKLARAIGVISEECEGLYPGIVCLRLAQIIEEREKQDAEIYLELMAVIPKGNEVDRYLSELPKLIELIKKTDKNKRYQYKRKIIRAIARMKKNISASYVESAFSIFVLLAEQELVNYENISGVVEGLIRFNMADGREYDKWYMLKRLVAAKRINEANLPQVMAVLNKVPEITADERERSSYYYAFANLLISPAAEDKVDQIAGIFSEAEGKDAAVSYCVLKLINEKALDLTAGQVQLLIALFSDCRAQANIELLFAFFASVVCAKKNDEEIKLLLAELEERDGVIQYILHEIENMVRDFYQENSDKQAGDFIKKDIDVMLLYIQGLVLLYNMDRVSLSANKLFTADIFNEILLKIILRSWFVTNGSRNGSYDNANAGFLLGQQYLEGRSIDQVIGAAFHEVMHNVIYCYGNYRGGLLPSAIHELLADVAKICGLIYLGLEKEAARVQEKWFFKKKEEEGPLDEEHRVARVRLGWMLHDQDLFINPIREQQGKQLPSLMDYWLEILQMGEHLAWIHEEALRSGEMSLAQYIDLVFAEVFSDELHVLETDIDGKSDFGIVVTMKRKKRQREESDYKERKEEITVTGLSAENLVKMIRWNCYQRRKRLSEAAVMELSRLLQAVTESVVIKEEQLQELIASVVDLTERIELGNEIEKREIDLSALLKSKLDPASRFRLVSVIIKFINNVIPEGRDTDRTLLIAKLEQAIERAAGVDPKERVVMLSLMRKAAYEGILAAEVDLERLTLSEWRDDTQRAPRGMGVLFAGTREELKREMSRQFVEGSVIAFYPRKLAWLIVILDLFAEFGGALDQVVQPLVGAIDSGEESGKENVRRYLREYIIQPGNLSALRAKLRILHKIISRSAKPHYFWNKKIKIFLGEDKFFSRGLALGYAGRFSEINSVYLHINHIRDCQGFRHLFEHEVWHHSPDGQQANKIVHAWQSEEEKAEVMAYGWGLLLENISAELVDPTEPLVLEALRTLGLSGIDVSL